MPLFFRRAPLAPLDDRGPLKILFLIDQMSVGGAETLLANLLLRLDRARFAPELGCMRELGQLGEQLASQIPAFPHLLRHKYDLSVVPRLANLLHTRRIDAVVTVGAGDRMFWGRLAAARARVPIVVSALHSTGWPDRIGRLNRLLTPLTDAFIGVATPHAQYLIDRERFPQRKVRVIPNGVDTDRFAPQPPDPNLRREFGLPPDAPLAGIVAVLRPEKNHQLLLRAAARVRAVLPAARWLIIGDGPCRQELQALAASLDLSSSVIFAGARSDVSRLLPLLDCFVLPSQIEANPVSILEAAACAKPVVATRVGSVPETVLHGQTGLLVEPGDKLGLAAALLRLLADPQLAATMGRAARENVVAYWSLERMVYGYEQLLTELYEQKLGAAHDRRRTPPAPPAPADPADPALAASGSP